MTETEVISIKELNKSFEGLVKRSRIALICGFIIVIIIIICTLIPEKVRNQEDPIIYFLSIVTLVDVVCFFVFGLDVNSSIKKILERNEKIMSKIPGFERAATELSRYRFCLLANLALFFFSILIFWFTLYHFLQVLKIYNKLKEISDSVMQENDSSSWRN